MFKLRKQLQAQDSAATRWSLRFRSRLLKAAGMPATRLATAEHLMAFGKFIGRCIRNLTQASLRIQITTPLQLSRLAVAELIGIRGLRGRLVLSENIFHVHRTLMHRWRPAPTMTMPPESSGRRRPLSALNHSSLKISAFLALLESPWPRSC